MTQDQTSSADGANPNPTDKTAAADQTVKEQPKVQEPAIDYEAKFKNSQDEAMRLKKSLESAEEQWQRVTPILNILNENPEIMRQVDDVYTGSSSGPTNSASQAQILDALVERKTKEKLGPILSEIDQDRRQRVEDDFKEFVTRYPDAKDHWPVIEQQLKGQKAAGIPLKEGLENAYFIAKKNEVKKQGKKEMAFEIYQREQAVAAGGSSSSFGSGEDGLTAEESKVAQELGLKPEDYQSSKLKIK